MAPTEGAAERQATFGRKAAERAPADPDKTTGQDWTIQIHRTGLIEKGAARQRRGGGGGLRGAGGQGRPPHTTNKGKISDPSRRAAALRGAKNAPDKEPPV